MVEEHFLYANIVRRGVLGYVFALFGSQKPICRFIDQGGVNILCLTLLSLTEQSIFRQYFR